MPLIAPIGIETNDEGEHRSNWPDAVVVKVVDGLPVSEFTLSVTGKKFAKTI